MEKRFIVPASTFLSGIIVWVTLLLITPKGEQTLMPELLLGVVTGGLIFFSAVRCRQAGGPRGGNIFRTVLLLALALMSYFFIGSVSAVVMLVSGVFTSLLLFTDLFK